MISNFLIYKNPPHPTICCKEASCFPAWWLCLSAHFRRSSSDDVGCVWRNFTQSHTNRTCGFRAAFRKPLKNNEHVCVSSAGTKMCFDSVGMNEPCSLDKLTSHTFYSKARAWQNKNKRSQNVFFLESHWSCSLTFLKLSFILRLDSALLWFCQMNKCKKHSS